MNSKKYPTKKGYKLWIDQPEAIVETLHYVPKQKSIDCDKNKIDDNKTEPSDNTNIEKKSEHNLDWDNFMCCIVNLMYEYFLLITYIKYVTILQ